MKLPSWWLMLACLAVSVPASAAVSEFDFEGNFAARTGPATMSLFNDKAFGVFDTDTINGQSTGVYKFNVPASDEGLRVDHGAPPNGGGAYVNEYTLGFDIKWTGGAPWASFYQTNTANSNDGDLFRNPEGGIGISGEYAGSEPDDTWNRVMFVFDLADENADGQTLYKYINGTQVGTQNPGGLDGRFSLDPFFLLLTDNDGESSAGSISAFLFEDRALSSAEIERFNGPKAGGFLPGTEPIPEPSTMVLLGLGAAFATRRRKASR